jgi:hypothetical protein
LGYYPIIRVTEQHEMEDPKLSDYCAAACIWETYLGAFDIFPSHFNFDMDSGLYKEAIGS